MLKYTFSWTYTTVQSPLWPCPCPLPPSILALGPWPWHWPSPCTQPYNFAHILLQNIAQEVFFTTLHTSYCKHCIRSYFHNFEHILLQNFAQDIVYSFARMLSQNIVQEISPTMETLVYKINFRIYHRNFAQHKVLCT